MTQSIAEKAIKDGLGTLKKAVAPWSPDVQAAFAKVDAAGKAIALQLAAAIFTVCVKQRAVPVRAKGEEESAVRWENVAASVLDGVLDYHDKDESDTAKLAISRAFYKNIALNFFSSSPSSAAFSIVLRQNVYTLLCYTATHHSDNQETLRQLITPRKMGQAIYACRDSLPQDELLNTLGTMIPRVRKGQPENRARALQLLRECFDQPGAHPAGAEIARLVESRLDRTDWSETVEKIGALLARDITLCVYVPPWNGSRNDD
ncbi:hypothetical protein PENSPDRAFT_392340 [Peniophora sp. CONT]|nr:hypothetical protein PENSPDRAFT_392340 [Peniophora sp. CONT]